MTPTPSPDPEPRWWCAVAGEMSATRACDDTEWEHSLCGWQQPAASSPDEGAERPGGWVDGIGWVALLTSLPTGTYYSWFETDTERNWRMVGDPYTVMRLKRYSVHGPAIVRRWADGTTPAPPAPSPCPYIVTGGEGTSHCSLAERSAIPPTPTPQADRDKLEIDVEELLIDHCGMGGTSALTDRILALTDAFTFAAASPSTPADPHPTDPTGSEA